MAKPRWPLLREPDDRVIRTGWLLWAGWLMVAGALLLHDTQAGRGWLAAVLVAPFWLLWMLWPLYRGFYGWQRWQQTGFWGQWQGRYFEFDGRQIRVYFSDAEVVEQEPALWFDADDVFDALALRGRQRDIERARLIAGRDGLIHPPKIRRLAFSEAGLAAWLERRSDPSAYKFSRWVDKQVIEPFRRRLELHGPDS